MVGQTCPARLLLGSDCDQAGYEARLRRPGPSVTGAANGPSPGIALGAIQE